MKTNLIKRFNEKSRKQSLIRINENHKSFYISFTSILKKTRALSKEKENLRYRIKNKKPNVARIATLNDEFR